MKNKKKLRRSMNLKLKRQRRSCTSCHLNSDDVRPGQSRVKVWQRREFAVQRSLRSSPTQKQNCPAHPGLSIDINFNAINFSSFTRIPRKGVKQLDR